MRQPGRLVSIRLPASGASFQEESRYCEPKKHDGACPVIGVNTFLNPNGMAQQEIELARSTEEEKPGQIRRLRDFQAKNASTAAAMLEKLQQTVIDKGNVFAVLVDTVSVCTPARTARRSTKLAVSAGAANMHVSCVGAM